MIATCAMLSVGGAMWAQGTIYDAVRVMGSDLNGTARYIGMGGAMGALGADITTMGTNPAGIGLYRSSDAMVSFGFSNSKAKSTFGSQMNQSNHTYGTFDNAGIVYAYKVGNQTPIRYVNFGFNYRRVKSFNRDFAMNGTFNASQTEQMADMANRSGATLGELEAKGAYSNPDIPWLGIMGCKSDLINPWYDEEGKLGGYDPFFQAGNEVDGVYHSRERGGINAFDFNVSFNLNDRFYMGATLGAYYMDYTRRSTYSEDFFYYDNDASDWLTPGGYTLDNYFNTKGSGIDFKVGMILRPFESSPFRVGVSVHTPTFYRLTEYGSPDLNFDVDVYNPDKDKYEPHSGVVYPTDSYGNEWQSETVYKVVSPWRYNFSLGYTIGQTVALGAEYEYANFSKTKMRYDDGVDMHQETQDAKDMLNGVHTFKVGAEIKVAPTLSLRVGYNHITSAMKDEAFKWLPSNSVRTDTEYSNLKAANNYTAGIGYRGSFIYADLAYQFNTYKEHFYPFTYIDNEGIMYPDRTTVINKNNRVVLTLGVRF